MLVHPDDSVPGERECRGGEGRAQFGQGIILLRDVAGRSSQHLLITRGRVVVGVAQNRSEKLVGVCGKAMGPYRYRKIKPTSVASRNGGRAVNV